ncbi:MAG: glycosyltransferase family 2 protein [Kiritimatiellia bacterium]|jgi:glycosyltransferase involved in cell wall biosynthesis
MNDSTPPRFLGRKTAIIIPAFNEAEAIGLLLDEARACMPGVKTIVISDGSLDDTAKVALAHGADVLDLPCNLGVGGAVQAGMRHAWDIGHRLVVRLDGDGQHPPSEIPKLLETMEQTGADLVVGSRFLGSDGDQGGTAMRKIGNRLLSVFLSVICRARVTDPTSGFWCVRDDLLRYFSLCYPCEYPEPEALALLRRQGYEMAEADVVVRPRRHGVSTIGSIDTLYFALRVALALVADRVRPVDRRFANPRNRKGD